MSGATYGNMYDNRRNHNDYDPILPAALLHKVLQMTIYTSRYVTKAVVTHIIMAHPAFKLDKMSCGVKNEGNP